MRRLPVLQDKPADDVPVRPSWQWVLIGAALAICLWVPLLTVSLWIRTRLVASRLPQAGNELTERVQSAGSLERVSLALSTVLPILLPWVIACACAGALVGRFGGAANRRHAGYSGLVASALALAVAALGGGFASPPALLASAVALASGAWFAGWLGGKFGERRRKRA